MMPRRVEEGPGRQVAHWDPRRAARPATTLRLAVVQRAVVQRAVRRQAVVQRPREPTREAAREPAQTQLP